MTSVPEAIRYLGVRKAISSAIAIDMQASQSSFSHNLPESVRTWHQTRSLVIACTSAAIAEQLETVSGETAHVLELLQDIGPDPGAVLPAPV